MLSLPSPAHSSLLPEPLGRYLLKEYALQEEEITSESVEYQNVKITPANMVFQRAFEGKKYYQKLTIQNCGKVRAFIRICPPSSYPFQIKTIVRGQYLWPGLSIVRYISYTYMGATAVPLAWIPIYINEQQLDYKLLVSLSKVVISAIPQQIDFGRIDAGQSAAVRMLSLRNDGSKGTRFAIDLGRNEIELIVEPSKGIIQPHDTVTFRVECLGTAARVFSREFWVKCETPLRIGVKGEIITQQLHSFHPNATQDFTLVDFPKTYFGTHCIKTLVIKNLSSMAAAYCTLAELADQNVNMEEAHNYKSDYSNFKVTPVEGYLLPMEGRIFQFTYKPIRDATKRKEERYEKSSFCSLRIIRIPCMDLTQIAVPEEVTVQDQELLSRYPAADDTLSTSDLLSRDEEASFSEFEDDITRLETPLSLANIVRVVLYGEAEPAGMTVRPDSLDLLEVPNTKPVTRELLLINQSTSLPIMFKYKKTCFVNVEPKSGLLPPSGKLEVCVIVTSAKIGKVETKIVFDLMYFNQPKEVESYVVVGYAEVPLTFNVPSVTASLKPKFNAGITPTYIKEVGFFTDDVRFNTPIEMPRSTLVKEITKTPNRKNSDLIAFPNDRPKSLRPWKISTKCRTICAGIPRAVSADPDKYELSKSRSDLKHKQYSYFKNYARQKTERLRRLHDVPNLTQSDYDVSNLLLSDAPKPTYTSIKSAESKTPSSFIPLTPSQLSKIRVYPYDIKLGKMAPNSALTKTITVHNKNDFSVRIFAKSRKPVIDFPKGDRKIVKPFMQVEMQATYISSTVVGRYNVIIDFIVNDNHTFAVWMRADVVPRCVKFHHEDVVFESDETLHRYLDVFNPVNVPVAFQWQVPDSCFTFEPAFATIPPRRHLTCLATYTPHHAAPSSVEVTLCSEIGRHQTVNVVANQNLPKVALRSTKIEFYDIPLNLPIQGTASLKNLGNELVTFAVLNPESMKGISVTPTEGVFHGYAEQLFKIHVKLSACITFSCTVEIEVQKIKTVKLHISGKVVYPQIIIKPEVLQLRRIVPYSFERQVFHISNNSTAKATIEFRLEDCSEYTILETHDFDIRSTPIKKIVLEADEEKLLYLHFNPMGAGSYHFYLPIVINDLLGPAYLIRSDTLSPSFYTKANENEYINFQHVKVTEMSKNLPVLTVSTAVGGDILRFSKLHLRFKYLPYSQPGSEAHSKRQELKICNASKDTCRFCIRTDELKSPFSLTYFKGNEIETLPYSIVCVLGPNEDLTLQAEFFPRYPGTYHIKLPIYVRNYLEGSVFNFLSFTGYYPAPIISALENSVFLEPVPLNCETEYSLFLKTEYHPPTCKLTAKTDISELQINFTSETISEEAKPTKEVRVLLKCRIKTSTFFDSDVKFFCDCGAECYINIKGCSDNCTVTTHPFVQAYTKTLCSQPPFCKNIFAFSKSNAKTGKSHGSFEENADTNTISTLYSTGNVFKFNTNYNESCFPIFPDEHDQTEYAKHMRSSIVMLEEWLFHQGFCKRKYYKIPDGIAATPEPSKKSEKPTREKKKETIIVLKVVELLTNLVGPQINKYIPIRKIPEETLNRVNYLYNVYVNVKEFIVVQGGLLPHVLPETLLCYDDYVVFMKSIYPYPPKYHEANAAELLDEQKFYRLSKQSWMDLLLQIYKVFILARIRIPSQLTEVSSNKSKQSGSSGTESYISSNLSQASFVVPTEEFIKQPTSQASAYSSRQFLLNNEPANESPTTVEDTGFWREFCRAEPRNSNIFKDSETILLHWLEYHFNQQREVLWGPNGLCPSEIIPENRNIKFFGFDLNDGLVLIAVTSVFCPYLAPYLNDTYLNPTNVEHAFHNASKLLQSWNMIKLSFTITPKQIIYPNGLQMLMLVNYLYEVLPTFYPQNTIYFKTGLSTSCLENITVENLSGSVITYTVIFFKNERQVFSTPSTTINIQPRQKIKIRVKFTARNIGLENVIMVLNGETPKRNYAKSLAFTLIGEPIPSYSTTTATIPSPLYQLLDVSLEIQSPYRSANVADIYYTTEEPNDVRTCKLLSWATEKLRKVPKRILSRTVQLEFNKEGVGKLDLTLCCVTTRKVACWVIFKNPAVGDFTIKIISVPETTTKIYTTIPVLVPEEFDTFRCSCKGNDTLPGSKQCPKTIFIQIPCRNDLLWRAVTESMMKIVDERDLPFWQKYLGTTAGIHINKWIAENPKTESSYDIQEIFDGTVNYNIIQENVSRKISLPSTTTIQNIHLLGSHGIPVHVNSNAVQNFNFTLESEKGLELRHYSVHFLTKKEYDNDMQLVNVN